ncbi:hypothetical protein NM208_g1510 [Fusarium decemcellulare]|uniref:Uncharacterized protein n=1 Tax=Fusarium decemcellulare TaxID=57161 RepID=A0ACC1SVX9_9HYPO|nr:hypothetical protein NM208_g1510 [Fusarium decemcellulare]
MAEVVGIAAAATQFLDLSVRVLSATHHLYARFKSVPEEINAMKESLDQFKSILDVIQQDSRASPILANSSLNAFSPLLSNALKELEEILHLFGDISFNSSSSVKRAWDVAFTSKIRRKITERCRRIERLKPDLIILYQHYRGLKLEHQVLSQSTHLRTDVSSGFSSLEQRLSEDFQLLRREIRQLSVRESMTKKRRDLTTLRNRACKCYPSSKDSELLSFTNFQILFSKKQLHSPGCPHKDKSVSWSLGFRSLSPRLQVMLGIRLGTSLSIIQEISPHNIVDAGTSPAFIALIEAHRELEYLIPDNQFTLPRGFMLTTQESTCKGLTVNTYAYTAVESSTERRIIQVFSTLLQSLASAFRAGTASPCDRTQKNVTVLHAFIDLAMKCCWMQEKLYPLLDQTIQILVSGSEDPNSVGRPNRVLNFYNEDLTPLGIVSLYWDHACHPAHMAVINRSEHQLRQLLRIGRVDIHAKSLPLVALAVGWPVGLKILLESGADPNDGILPAVREGHIPSIRLLLDYGCDFFQSEPGSVLHTGYDLLSEASIYACHADVFCLLIEKLAQRRRALLRLALKNLPGPDLDRLGLRSEAQECDQSLLDQHAREVFHRLIAAEIKVPAGFWPGKESIIYHHHDITYSLAKKLYSMGFHDIDVPKDGTSDHTPLYNAISRAPLDYADVSDHLRLIVWYLEKGARLPVEPSERFRLFLPSWNGILTSTIWINEGTRLDGPLELLRQLYPQGALIFESGTCRCNVAGFNPSSLVLQSQNGPFDLTGRRRWLFHLPRYAQMGLPLTPQCFQDICRLEIFERLGMAHTCCSPFKSDDSTSLNSESSEEAQELEEEDILLASALESHLRLYSDLHQRHSSNFEAFWLSWWIALEHHLPFETDQLWSEHDQELQLPDGLALEEQSSGRISTFQGDSYEPRTGAISSIVGFYVASFTMETVDEFLNQFATGLGKM